MVRMLIGLGERSGLRGQEDWPITGMERGMRDGRWIGVWGNKGVEQETALCRDTSVKGQETCSSETLVYNKKISK